jgi:protein dithiol:quinone oxidoreductase
MTLPITRRTGNALGFLTCAGLMAYALYAQHVLGLAPCPLCIFQRVAVIALGAIFLAAALHNPAARGARVYAGLQLLAVTFGVLVSSRHIWIQMQPKGAVPDCGADLDYLLDILPLFDVVKKVLFGSGECQAIDWSFLGLSMPWWVAISQVALGAWALLVNAPARNATGGGLPLRP